MEYDGTPFSGWQVQNNRITVQGELEKVISLILNQPVKITGSGRTDAGVHAMGQVANFISHTRISPSELKKGLNSLIKSPIVILTCEEVDAGFHARYSAFSKEYHYHILNRELPCAIGRNYVWHIRKPLDIEAMNHCCSMLIGEHDFKSFEGAGSPRAHTVRTLYHAFVEKYKDSDNGDGKNGGSDENHKSGNGENGGNGGNGGNGENNKSDSNEGTGRDEDSKSGKIIIKVKGNGFLRFMVRNIAGTLVMSGHHQITPERFKAILHARDRQFAGATAPARGLCLMQVNY